MAKRLNVYGASAAKRIVGNGMRIVHTERGENQRRTIADVEKLAKSGKWNFDHVVFYLQKIIGLPLGKVNELVDAWNL
jgi:hypothetical protein